MAAHRFQFSLRRFFVGMSLAAIFAAIAAVASRDMRWLGWLYVAYEFGPGLIKGVFAELSLSELLTLLTVVTVACVLARALWLAVREQLTRELPSRPGKHGE